MLSNAGKYVVANGDYAIGLLRHAVLISCKLLTFDFYKPLRHMETPLFDEFYQQMEAATQLDLRSLLPNGINQEIGHFNVFAMTELLERLRQKPVMAYNRRAYFKISLISGPNRTEYADKVIDIRENALLFATPKVPYHWRPMDMNLAGYFCIFTEEFLVPTKSGVVLDELPLFRPGGYPVFELPDEDVAELTGLFKRMQAAMASDYAYKYDLLRTTCTCWN